MNWQQDRTDQVLDNQQPPADEDEIGDDTESAAEATQSTFTDQAAEPVAVRATRVTEPPDGVVGDAGMDPDGT